MRTIVAAVITGLVLVATAFVLTGCNTEVHDRAATDAEAEVAQSQVQRQEASDEIEPLSLSLSVSQQICETERGYEEGVVHSELDAQGNRTQRDEVFGWSGIASVPVLWSVSGGNAPYGLVIDGESGYRDSQYVGSAGTATVGCADTSGGTSFPLR